jgi:hypothetical protein
MTTRHTSNNAETAREDSLEQSGGHGHRLGRPPRPAETVRSQRVVTFVTPAELEALERLSERWKTSMSATVHRLVYRALESATETSQEAGRRTS